MFKLNRTIKDEEEKASFIRNLSFYRSFIFKFVEFQIETNYLDIKDIVMALNIKNKKERITFVFDKTIEIVEKFYENEGDVCDFKCGQCHVQRISKDDKVNGCCRFCKYQSGDGCTTKNVACKFFNCDDVRKHHKVLEYDQVELLRVLDRGRRDLLRSDYFSSREDIIKDVRLGVVLGTIRMYSRFLITGIKMIFFKEKKSDGAKENYR